MAQGHIRGPHARVGFSNGCCQQCDDQHPQIVRNNSGFAYWASKVELAAMFPFGYTNDEMLAMFDTPELFMQTRDAFRTRIGDK
jgi:hypothetical protein